MKRPPTSSVDHQGRPVTSRLVDSISKQVRFSPGSTATIRPPQRTGAPAIAWSTAWRGVIWVYWPCRGTGGCDAQAATRVVASANAARRERVIEVFMGWLRKTGDGAGALVGGDPGP